MENIDRLKEDIVFSTHLLNNPITFHTTWGLFSPKAIDEGSSLLLKNIEINPTNTVLDLGCGYGALGVPIAKIANKGTVYMVDKDFIAVRYAKKNAAINHARNIDVYLSNGFSSIEESFDVIVSNLPAKIGKELTQIFLHDAKAHLKTGGKLYIVTISGLKEFMKRNIKEIFGNYDKLAQSKTYTVAMAVKE